MSVDTQPDDLAPWLRASKNGDPRMLKPREDIAGHLRRHLEAHPGRERLFRFKDERPLQTPSPARQDVFKFKRLREKLSGIPHAAQWDFVKDMPFEWSQAAPQDTGVARHEIKRQTKSANWGWRLGGNFCSGKPPFRRIC
jgi:hypothetical protein